MKRGEGISEVEEIIEAEYRVVVEKGEGEGKNGEDAQVFPSPKAEAKKIAEPAPARRRAIDIKPGDLPDTAALVKMAEELWGIPPDKLWLELNYNNRRDFEDSSETPWECFLRLKMVWDPPEQH